MTITRFIAAAAALSFSATAFGAGTHGHGHGQNAAIGEPAAASDATRTVTVAMYDNYYEPETIDVQQGEVVRFVVENHGQLVHEFNLGTPTCMKPIRKKCP